MFYKLSTILLIANHNYQKNVNKLLTFDEVDGLLKAVRVPVAVVQHIGAQFDAGQKVGLIIQPIKSVEHALQGLRFQREPDKEKLVFGELKCVQFK